MPVKIVFEDRTEENYDPDFVKKRILLAGREDDPIDEELAEELAGLAELFLKKEEGGRASVDRLDQMVFTVLREAGHIKAAAEYSRNIDLEGSQTSAAFYLDSRDNHSSVLGALGSEESPLQVVALFEQGAYLIFKQTKWRPDDCYIYKMTYERVQKRRHIVQGVLRINPGFMIYDREAQLIHSNLFGSLADVLESSHLSYYAIARNQRRKEIFLRGYHPSIGTVSREDVGQDIGAALDLLAYNLESS